jgi:hypothetical protein
MLCYGGALRSEHALAQPGRPEPGWLRGPVSRQEVSPRAYSRPDHGDGRDTAALSPLGVRPCQRSAVSTHLCCGPAAQVGKAANDLARLCQSGSAARRRDCVEREQTPSGFLGHRCIERDGPRQGGSWRRSSPSAAKCLRSNAALSMPAHNSTSNDADARSKA